MSGGSPQLAARLEPVVEFFALGKRKPAKKKEPASTATEISASPRS